MLSHFSIHYYIDNFKNIIEHINPVFVSILCIDGDDLVDEYNCDENGKTKYYYKK